MLPDLHATKALDSVTAHAKVESEQQAQKDPVILVTCHMSRRLEGESPRTPLFGLFDLNKITG